MDEHLRFALRHPRQALRLYETAYGRMVFADVIERVEEHKMRVRVEGMLTDAVLAAKR